MGRYAALMAIVALCGCGRCGYDLLGAGAGAGADGSASGRDGAVVPGDRDGSTGGDEDASPDGRDSGGGGGTCGGGVMSSCASRGWIASLFGSGNQSGDTLNSMDRFEGSCGGAGGVDSSAVIMIQSDGVLELASSGSDFDTVLYVRDGGDCMGAELACDDDSGPGGTSRLSVPVTSGQRVVLVIDGKTSNDCGRFQIQTSMTP